VSTLREVLQRPNGDMPASTQNTLFKFTCRRLRTREIMGYGVREKQKKQSAKADTCRSHQGNGEAESRYVCKRVEFRFFQNEVLVVENDVEE
jgi:hypothetical protein